MLTTTHNDWQGTRGFMGSAVAGAMVLTWFGAAWAFTALANQPATPAWQYVAVTVLVSALTAAGYCRVVAISARPVNSLSADAAIESAGQGRRIGALFGAIVTLEVAAIATAASLLAGMGRPLLIPVAVVAIVGAHVLPLARVFRVPTYGVGGLILLVCAAASLLIGDEATRVFALAVSTATVLWMSAVAVLVLHTRVRSVVS